MMAVDLRNLPEQYSLPSVPVLNQLRQGACVGHGCAAAREILEVIGGNPPPLVPLSRAWIYFKAREMEHSQDQDSGAEVRDGCRVLQSIGVPTEATFPYNDQDFRTAPPDVDLTEAALYKIASYARLNSSDEIRAAIANNQPVVIGISVFQSFETQVGADGLVPLPSASESELGGHCMCIKGYRPDPRNLGMYLFDVQNSWGPDWADHGVCYISQGYFNNPNLCSDLWSISL
jgi:C1A family cysteine protease